MTNKDYLRINKTIKDIQENFKQLKQDLKNNVEYDELIWDLARIQDNNTILKAKLFAIVKRLKNEN